MYSIDLRLFWGVRRMMTLSSPQRFNCLVWSGLVREQSKKCKLEDDLAFGWLRLSREGSDGQEKS